jgi:galactose mutarotase-like enzyme
MIHIESEALKILIKPAGAELCSVKNSQGLEFLWQATKNIWPRHAPVLFPIVGKLKDNAFLYKDHSYLLGQHGFARDMDFEMIAGDKRSCELELRSNEETLKKFPFQFSFRIKYLIDGNRLTTTYKVFNSGTDKLFFSVGAHPGFRCPLLANETFEDYYLQFERSTLTITGLDNGLRLAEKQTVHLQEKIMPLTTSLFDKDALVLEKNQVDSVSLCSRKSSHQIKMECEGWPYFGIWTKKDCNEFICLEPWFGIADSVRTDQKLSKKEGILALDPGKDFACSFFIAFT